MQNLVSAQWLSYLGKIEQLQLGIRMAFGYINKVFDFAWQQHAISSCKRTQWIKKNRKEKKIKISFYHLARPCCRRQRPPRRRRRRRRIRSCKCVVLVSSIFFFIYLFLLYSKFFLSSLMCVRVSVNAIRMWCGAQFTMFRVCVCVRHDRIRTIQFTYTKDWILVTFVVWKISE